jgi:hypothetical protein
MLLCGEVDHTVADNDVDVPVRRGYVLYLTFQKLRILDTSLSPVLPCQLQHLIGHVEAIGSPSRSHPPRREQHVYTAGAAEVEHDLTGRERSQRNGIPTPQRSIGGELWQLTPLSLGVAPTGHIYHERSPLPRLHNPATGRATPTTRTANLTFPKYAPRRPGVHVPYSLLELLIHNNSLHQEVLIQI